MVRWFPGSGGQLMRTVGATMVGRAGRVAPACGWDLSVNRAAGFLHLNGRDEVHLNKSNLYKWDLPVSMVWPGLG